jgi:DNA-binding IclR family transcriptional regulator
MAEAREQDGRVLNLLKDQPMRQVDLARAMDAGQSTVQARLTRLQKQGAVVRDDGGLWSLTTST